MVAQYRELVPDNVGVGLDIAGVPELRDQLEGDALAGPTDPEWWVRLLNAFRLIDGPVDRVVLPLEDGVVLAPHPVNDFAGFLEHSHPLFQLRKAVAVGAPF